MRKIVIAIFIIVFGLWLVKGFAGGPDDIGLEPLINKCFNTTYNAVKSIGMVSSTTTNTLVSLDAWTGTIARSVVDASNTDRAYIRLQNLSDDAVYISLATSTDAWITTGMWLYASGDTTHHDVWEGNTSAIYTGEISGYNPTAGHDGKILVTTY